MSGVFELTPFFLAKRPLIISGGGTIYSDASEDLQQLAEEFGVPIAGEILDPAHWTRTALKRLPLEGRLSWEALFGRRSPQRVASVALTTTSSGRRSWRPVAPEAMRRDGASICVRICVRRLTAALRSSVISDATCSA